MTKLMNGQVLFGLGLAALNTVYASQVLLMERPSSNGEPGPAFLPVILCGFVYIGIFCTIIGEFRKSPDATADDNISDTIPWISVLGPVLVIGLTALFIVTFVYLGYAVAAAGYTFLIALYFNYEQSGSWGKSALTAVAISAFVTFAGWIFFVKLFDLYLPVWEF